MKFSNASQGRLDTCDNRLQDLFEAVIAAGHDCTIIEGHRNREAQDEYFRTGKSKMKWPDGKHCKIPSMAVDVMPCPINWSDRKGLEAFALIVFATAAKLGIAVRWGGDWNQNGKSDDERFFDGPHWEIVEPVGTDKVGS
ncbi:MAG: M15 family peptidase [Caulobacteraceae bacterium]|nr:M15 family peptidase [Caulobacteraceae bacterium]